MKKIRYLKKWENSHWQKRNRPSGKINAWKIFTDNIMKTTCVACIINRISLFYLLYQHKNRFWYIAFEIFRLFRIFHSWKKINEIQRGYRKFLFILCVHYTYIFLFLIWYTTRNLSNPTLVQHIKLKLANIFYIFTISCTVGK